MDIDEILDEWSNDCVVDETNLSVASTNIPILHSKYISMYTNARLRRTRLYEKRKQVKKNLWEYYDGKMCEEDLKEIGREQFQLNLINSQITTYVDSDDEMININLKIGYQDELIRLLEDIVKSIHTRGFVIKNSLDYQRFMNGG